MRIATTARHQTAGAVTQPPLGGCRGLAIRSVLQAYETIRQWCLTFGPRYARTLRRRRGRMGDTWHLDELFVTLNGRRQYLWRAVDEDGDVIDV